jgi:beta-galactosidase
MRQAMLELDQTRPIHYEGDHKSPDSDVVSTMYPSPAFLEKLAQGKKPLRFAKAGETLGRWIWPKDYGAKPILICEFAHAMGNSISRLERFQEIFEKYPHCAGGFIWDMIDQSLIREGKKGSVEWTYGGDWGDEPNDSYFCINGLFQPDLIPNPHAYEVHKVYQPIAVTPGDLLAGEVILHNKNWFTNLDNLGIRWILTKNGEIQELDYLEPPDLSPGGEEPLKIPVTLPELARIGEEYHLLVEFLLREDCAWAKRGFRVAWEQFSLPLPIMIGKDKSQIQSRGSATTPMLIHPREDMLEILTPEVKFGFDTHTGFLKSVQVDDIPGLIAPLAPNFTRRLDNDLISELLVPKIGRLLSLERKWNDAKENLKLIDFNVERLNYLWVQITSTYAIKQASNPLRITYLIDQDGGLEVHYTFKPRYEALRIGLQTEISGDLSRVSWFGRGPHETMPDRKGSGIVGIHHSSSDEIQFPYIHPQENGNRSDVRWVEFFNQTGKGFRVEGIDGGLINFSLWPYTQEDLRNTSHNHELPKRDFYTLNIDLAQRGVGDLQSAIYGWDPDTRLRRGKEYHLRFRITPLWNRSA